MAHPAYKHDLDLTPTQGDPLASLNLAPIPRPVPFTEDRLRAMAEEEYPPVTSVCRGHALMGLTLADLQSAREQKVREFIGKLRVIDGALVKNGRMAK